MACTIPADELLAEPIDASPDGNPHLVRVFSDPALFERATRPIGLPIPNSATAFPGTSCGSGDIGPTGMGACVTIPFASNGLTITGATDNALFTFDTGTIIRPFGNTVPDRMLANTIVANGEDDFHLKFDQPVRALGLRLLTNYEATERVTFRDSNGDIVATVDVSSLT